MPFAKMSPNPALQQSYFRIQFAEPKQCSGQFEKVANLRRAVDGIKKERQSFLSQNDNLKLLNQGLLVSRLVKETCYSFLDLTGAIAGDVIEAFGGAKAKPYAAKIKLYATGGMAAIDMSEVLSERAFGRGSWGNVVETGIKSGVSMAGALANTPTQSAAAYLGTQGVNSYEIGKAGIQGNKKKAIRSTETLAFDNVLFLLEGIQNEVTGAGRERIRALKTATATVKASRRYSAALDDALSEYLETSELANTSRRTVLHSIDQTIQHVEKSLDKALSQYQQCINSSPF
ncbi:hypothetical protein ROE7235_01723 [Roseibaca ekhonensis]|uniref:Uncharacterized protein n=1 Tax=Roseinatronobacter ekhonensis TaxID=254356 RepID=A0A3B0M7T4_9RHOB|nr:hypothetical protein [Roseibaca ekhonensis]SUZ31972.1 hypothetical protein ROE7235_01723 [Roseibaca ekhonensis]